MSATATPNGHAEAASPHAAELGPDHRRVVWPPERFYWGVLNVQGLPRNADRGYLLEPLLPVPTESVHAVYAPAGEGRVLACAAPREALEELDPTALSLAPESLPDAVGDVEVDPARLNLLVGPYQPRQVRRLRAIWHISVAAILAAGAGLAILGLHERARVHERAATDVQEALNALYDQVLPGRLAGSMQNPALLLSTELERLRRTRTEAAPTQIAGDAALVLADLLAHWPGELMLRTESLTVAADEVTLTGLVDSAEKVEPLRSALGELDAWRLALPRTESTGDGDVRVTLRLTKEKP